VYSDQTSFQAGPLPVPVYQLLHPISDHHPSAPKEHRRVEDITLDFQISPPLQASQRFECQIQAPSWLVRLKVQDPPNR